MHCTYHYNILLYYFLSQEIGIEPASYSVALTAIDEIEELANAILETNFVQDTNSTNLRVIQPLPRRRLWNYHVLALNCSEHPVTNLLEFSKSSQRVLNGVLVNPFLLISRYS